MERSMHNQAMLLFHQYMLVGGMPMPVVAFIESKKDFTEAEKKGTFLNCIGKIL